MRNLLIFAVLLCSACQTPTVTKVQTHEVTMPVATHPLDPLLIPKLPDPLGAKPKNADGSTNLRAAADQLYAKLCEFEGYAIMANPMLQISAGLQPTDPHRFPECE